MVPAYEFRSLSQDAGIIAKDASKRRLGISFMERNTPKLQKMRASLSYPHIKGLTILGGEPFEPENQVALLPLIERVRRELKDKTIWMFSGYRLDDEILKEGVHPNTPISKRIISLIDVLVDGRFIEEKKNISLVFRGSENQRIIDVKKTLNEGKIVLWDERLTKE